MAIYDLPDNLFSDAELEHDLVQATTSSAYTGSGQTEDNPWHARWHFQSDHIPIIGETNILPWRAFFANLEGQANKFRVPVTESDQHSGSVVATVLSSSGTRNLVLANLPHSVTYLLGGRFLTVPLANGDEQLVALKADLVSDGSGHASASFFAPLRSAPDTGATVETKRPWVLGKLADPKQSIKVTRGQIYSLTLQGQESW